MFTRERVSPRSDGGRRATATPTGASRRGLGSDARVGGRRLPEQQERRRLEVVVERELAQPLGRVLPVAEVASGTAGDALAARVLAARHPERVRRLPAGAVALRAD